MKRVVYILMFVIILLPTIFEGCSKKDNKLAFPEVPITREPEPVLVGTTNLLYDKYGVYKTVLEDCIEYKTMTRDDVDGFYGKMIMKVKDGEIIDVKYTIIDNNGWEFDENYWKYYVPHKQRMMQAKYDYYGLQYYITQLIDKQDINKVDAITGATWSWKLFVEGGKQMMEKAKPDMETSRGTN